MEQIEVSGKTVDAAVENALKRLGRKRHEVAVEVLSNGSRGILGIGGEQALVRVTVREEEPEEEEEEQQASRGSAAPAPPRPSFFAPRPAPPPPAPPRPVEPRPEPPRVETPPAPPRPIELRPEPARPEPPRVEPPRAEPPRPRPVRLEPPRPAPPSVPIAAVEAASVAAGRKALAGDAASVAVEVVETLLRHMGVRAKVNIRRQDAEKSADGEQPVIMLDITGDELGILIGRRGETLASLQFLTNLIVGKRAKQWTRVVIDVEQYRERREERLRSLALHMAERVIQTGQPVTLTAMPANERRIIHLALHDHPQVTTGSIDEGENRRVVILPL